MVQLLNECYLYDEFGSCNSYMLKRFNDWSSDIVNLSDLRNNVVSYLVQIGVIPRSNQGSYEISECNLILNRLVRYIDIEQPYLKICSLHRYTFGVGWKDNRCCAHIDHINSSNIVKIKKSKRPTNNRIAPFHLIQHLAQFPFGGRLCSMHRTEIYSIIQATKLTTEELSTFSGIHSYEIEAEKITELNNTNTLLISLEQSPLKSQTMVPLEEQPPSAIRRLTSKLRKAVFAAASNIAEGIIPGQGKALLELADLNIIGERRPSNVSISSNTAVDEEYLEYLIKMYHSYEENNLPFNEQVRVLTLIPKSWNLKSSTIQKKFNCSRHAVKTARRLSKITNIPLHIDEKIPKTRQRVDSKKIDYFINWIVESDLLTSIPWGSTALKLDNGGTITIPKQVLQAQKSQIIHVYKQHCNEFNIDPLSDRTIYSILDSINPNEQKVISGIDDFVKDASEGWQMLKKLIQQLPITPENRNDMNRMLEKNILYLKSNYGAHCDEDKCAATHCTVFALSQTNNPFYSQSCNHNHDTNCTDCILIFKLFDQVEDSINEVSDEELRDELLYDFKVIWNNIFQYMAHRVRAAQQEQQKKKYISLMDDTTALLTVDWSQKVLPQRFREGQSSYFGKKGMSILVGSFAFKEPSTTTTVTKTYMLAFTQCSQTEYDTLSGAQVILEQFHHDYPHITKLIKRSDNASVLIGHSTIQCEKIFSDRVEYAGGIRNLKIAVAEVLETKALLPTTHVNEISLIRNITYEDNRIILRKATGIGIGKQIAYENVQVTKNVKLLSSFDKYESFDSLPAKKSSSTRTDRMFKKVIFCPNESCIDTFEQEDDLNVHILLNQHTTKDSNLRLQDKAKLILFEKMKNENISSSSIQSTTTITAATTTLLDIPRHYKMFQTQGWALRTKKPSRPIDKNVKAFVKLIFEQEKLYGRKTPTEEYVTRIRTARNSDGSKTFKTTQYLTYKQ
ncbi:unnamed protein product, partial [Rotaria sordida]